LEWSAWAAYWLPAADPRFADACSPWPWIDSDGVYHTLTHDGNGANGAGGHAFSFDGIHWHEAPMAFTGNVTWPNGTSAVLVRRERYVAQVLFLTLRISAYFAFPCSVDDTDGRLSSLFLDAYCTGCLWPRQWPWP